MTLTPPNNRRNAALKWLESCADAKSVDTPNVIRTFSGLGANRAGGFVTSSGARMSRPSFQLDLSQALIAPSQ
jgi:hypothetical protein